MISHISKLTSHLKNQVSINNYQLLQHETAFPVSIYLISQAFYSHPRAPVWMCLHQWQSDIVQRKRPVTLLLFTSSKIPLIKLNVAREIQKNKKNKTVSNNSWTKPSTWEPQRRKQYWFWSLKLVKSEGKRDFILLFPDRRSFCLSLQQETEPFITKNMQVVNSFRSYDLLWSLIWTVWAKYFHSIVIREYFTIVWSKFRLNKN